MPQDVKNRRVFEMAKVYRAGAEELNAACVGQKQLILIEGVRVVFNVVFFPHLFCFQLILMSYCLRFIDK